MLDGRPLIALLLVSPLVGQATIADPFADVRRAGAFAFYDDVRGRVTVAGGLETGTSGTTWDDTSRAAPAPVVQFEGDRRIVLPATFPARAFGCTAPGWTGLAPPLLFGGQNPDGSLSAETYRWNERGGTLEPIQVSGPSARKMAAMTTLRDGSTLLFGGFDGTQFLDDTWLFQSDVWMRLPAVPGPRARRGHAMVYERNLRVVVLYGGESASGALGDTWLFDGTAWTAVSASGPTARMGHAMAWDESRGRMLCYGGAASTTTATANDDVWEWRGTWRQVASHVSTCASHLVFDRRRRQMLAFGGFELSPFLPPVILVRVRSDLATYNGSTWSAIGVDVGTQGTGFPRLGQTMAAFDPRRDRITVIGGTDPNSGAVLGETWEGRLDVWQQRIATGATPGPRRRGGMVHSPGEGVHYLFGGENAVFLWPADLWRFDGTTWSIVPTSGPRPIPRVDGAMAYDPRGVLVLHGGRDAQGMVLADHWEFDLATRTWQLVPVAAPTLAEHTMGYDAARARLVVFGGVDASGRAVGATWEYDGNAWRQNLVAGGPVLDHPRMVYDEGRQRMVCAAQNITTANTYEYDGAVWTTIASTCVPDAMVYDAARHRVVAFSNLLGGEAWTYDGSQWSRSSVLPPPPLRARPGHSLSYDFLLADRAVLFGGRSGADFLEHEVTFDGHTWALQLPPVAPSARADHAACYSPADQCHVLYGGRGALGALRDTWTMDRNGTWVDESQAGPNVGRREHHAMCFHQDGNYVLLFGGEVQGTLTNDTATWRRATGWVLGGGSRVPPRRGHAMAYLPSARRTVLFGGEGLVGLLNDTWLYQDGVGWLPATPAHAPAPRRDHVMLHDPLRNRILLLGGRDAAGPRQDVWMFDGTDWLELPLDAGAVPSEASAFFDAQRRRVLIHGDGQIRYLWANVARNGIGDPASPAPLAQRTQPVIGTGFALDWPYPAGGLLLWGGPDAGVASTLGSCSPQQLFVPPVVVLPAAAPAAALALPDDPVLVGAVTTWQGFFFASGCLRLTDAANVVVLGH